LHNHVDTREELKQYDPKLARVCNEVFGDGAWRYVKPENRSPENRSHLQDVRFDNLPNFEWRIVSIPSEPRVRFQTTAGDFELLLDAEKAPVTVKNFLHYVHQGLYSDGRFHRTVTLSNQPDDAYKIEVIQASADPNASHRYLEPIPLERTSVTGLKHRAGVISMARDADADSGQHHFFICLSDSPELDFGGKRNPDGQGFAAFGKVTKGMDVINKIHQSEADGQTLVPNIRIQRAIRLN